MISRWGIEENLNELTFSSFCDVLKSIISLIAFGSIALKKEMSENWKTISNGKYFDKKIHRLRIQMKVLNKFLISKSYDN